MKLSFLPKIIVNSVTELTPEYLQEQGIALLMLDFDNTIVPYITNEPTKEMVHWLKTMVASEIKICVVSNSKRDRVKVFCDRWGIACITHAKKPFGKGIHQCLAQFGLPADQCALAGDQIYTDVLGANGCGVRSVLVKAICQHNIWLKLRHVAELPFIGIAKLLGRKK